jgi:GGDEF domain-containing protein
LADRVRAAVLAPLTTGDAVLQASVSVGVATSPPELDAAGLLAAADRAAYAAKRGGRNTVRVAP